MPRPHEMCLLEREWPPSPPSTGGAQTVSQGMGGRGHMFRRYLCLAPSPTATDDEIFFNNAWPLNLQGTAYCVGRIWRIVNIFLCYAASPRRSGGWLVSPVRR